MKSLILNGKDLTLEEISQVAYNGRQIEIAPDAMERVAHARQVLFDMAAKRKGVYGLNRGVGWNKDQEFDIDFFEQYNKNLFNSHSLVVGPDNSSTECVRAMMLIRLNKLLVGATGVSTDIVTLLKEFLNRGITPIVLHRGSIGEADLAPLAMVGQCIMGEGQVEYKGKVIPTMEAVRAEGLKLPVLGPKDGLGTVSSNAQGEALASMLVKETEELVTMGNLVYCLALEGLNGGVEPFGEKVCEMRGIKGQIECAAEMRKYLEGSYLYQPHPERALQDPLSFRCACSIHGTVLDALAVVKEYLSLMINRTDDNPCVLLDENDTCVSTNFEATTLALAVEMTAGALAHMSRTICHRTIKMADPYFTHLNRFLGPAPGIVIGFSTIQKTFQRLDSENRALANPSSMDGLALSGYIEDHSCNLPYCCDKALKMVDNIRYIMGIELMHAAQAIDLRIAKEGNFKMGKYTKKVYDLYRTKVDFLAFDRNLSIDIKSSYDIINSCELLTVLDD